jgi:hypothetical protein
MDHQTGANDGFVAKIPHSTASMLLALPATLVSNDATRTGEHKLGI